MKPPVFAYVRAHSVDEAVARLADGGPDTRLLAGGQSLIPMMKLRLARPAVLVDINPVRALDYVRRVEGELRIGATARTADLQAPAVRQQCPLLAAAADLVGHAAIRHRGTVCGSLAHGDPAAELPLAAVCLDATLVARSRRGERSIEASDFFRTFFSTSLDEDEMLVEARVPVPAARAGWSFLELTKRSGDFAIVAAAVFLERAANGRIVRVRIGLAAVADRPVRCTEAEQIVVDQRPGSAAFRAAAAAAMASLTPPTDIHASGDYRRKVARVLVERALTEAWEKAG
jgi:carbon-monoxide dehydrogenase medium subunit